MAKFADRLTERDLALIDELEKLQQDFEQRVENAITAGNIGQTYTDMEKDLNTFLLDHAEKEIEESQVMINDILALTGLGIVALNTELRQRLINTIKLGSRKIAGHWEKQKLDAAKANIANEDAIERLKKASKRNVGLLIHNAAYTLNNKARLFAYRAHPNIKGMQQISVLDGNTSEVCNRYAYKKWKLDGTPVGHTLAFEGGPPRHINCRSTIVPLEDVEATAKYQEAIMDYNSFDFEIKTIGEDGTIEGYGSVFDNTDSYNDIVAKGAFRKTLRERTPALLWQHDQSQPIGVWEEIKEDSRGLKMKGKINLDVQKGREAYSLLRQGAVNGLSIGFKAVKWEIDSKSRMRTLQEVKLFEVSIVTFPANEAATVTSVKSQIKNIIDDLSFDQQQKVLGYAEALKTLQHDEPDTTDDLDTVYVEDDITDVKGDEDSVHSGEEAVDHKSNEPQDLHSLESIRKLTKILKGEK